MKHTGWFAAAVALVFIQSAPAGAGSLEVRVEPGRVAVQADQVPLGQVVEALSQRAGLHVVLDAKRAAQPVTVRLEAGGIHEAIVRLMQEAGGGNYAMVSTNAEGKVEPFAFQHEGGGAATMSPPAPAAPAAPYAVGDGSPTYAPAPREEYEKAVTPSSPYPPLSSGLPPPGMGRSPGPAGPAAPALGADDDHGSASSTGRGELADLEYKRRLETTRKNLEKGANTTEDDE